MEGYTRGETAKSGGYRYPNPEAEVPALSPGTWIGTRGLSDMCG
jgi:hypothetical protein